MNESIESTQRRAVGWSLLVVLTTMLPLAPVSAAMESARLLEQRQLFPQAERLLRDKKIQAYRALEPRLVDYPLYPYLVFKELQPRLGTASKEEVRAFLDRYADTPLASTLRRGWLKLLYKRRDWSGFLADYQPTGNASMRCRHLFALFQSGDSKGAMDQVPSLWKVGHSQPSACDPIFKKWREAGRLTKDLVWSRIRLAMNSGHPGLADYLTRYLPIGERPLVDQWRRIREKPSRVTSGIESNHPMVPEIVAYGVQRWARRDPQRAAAAWKQLRKARTYTPDQIADTERTIGLALARHDQPDARGWLSGLDDRGADTLVRETLALLALKERDWHGAVSWIDRLDQKSRNSERWRYWRARGLEQMGQIDPAMDLFEVLSRNRGFYGFLAADRAQRDYVLNDAPTRVSDAGLDRVAALPGIRRARELYLLGRNLDARREWYQMSRRLKGEDLAAAAVIAHRWGWHDRAILTVARTGQFDDISLRFPLAYREPVLKQSRNQALDPAWVYAVMRQESAFAHDARSPKGAMGLMQLMPRTARQVAKRAKTRLRGRDALYQPDTNIRLGSSYLRTLLDELGDHPALATAAYNAGPHRVKKWLPEDGEQPADLWIEEIPFRETRDYLRRVFAYTAIYERRLGDKGIRLSQRLPPIPSKGQL